MSSHPREATARSHNELVGDGENGIARAAAINNARWCAAVWTSHGLRVEQANGCLLTRSDPPTYYPNAVTLEPELPVALCATLTNLARDRGRLAVKDSFASVDLTRGGFGVLFESRWLFGRAFDRAHDPAHLSWRRVEDFRSLALWHHAWLGGQPTPRDLFLPALLEDERVFFLAAQNVSGAIVGGAVAFASDGLVGLTNLFGTIDGLLSAVERLCRPEMIVRHERGRALEAAIGQGFVDAGPLRVWTYPA